LLLDRPIFYKSEKSLYVSFSTRLDCLVELLQSRPEGLQHKLIFVNVAILVCFVCSVQADNNIFAERLLYLSTCSQRGLYQKFSLILWSYIADCLDH